jgi:prevent-host-death family protein
MTRKSVRTDNDNQWQMQDAKARLSEVMRRARDVGPQHISVHGRDDSVVLSAEEYRKLKGDRRTGADLIAAFQAYPWPDDFALPRRFPMPVRDIDFP